MTPPAPLTPVNTPPCLPPTATERTAWFERESYSHDGQLRAYLRGAFPAVRAVDDIVQESYVRVWRRQAAQPIASAKAFLFTIARRLAIDWLRHEKVIAPEPVEDFSSGWRKISAVRNDLVRQSPTDRNNHGDTAPVPSPRFPRKPQRGRCGPALLPATPLRKPAIEALIAGEIIR